jgi:hormone-sensitive lipase
VFSVDYRLAPRNPYPDPLNDCYQAYVWIIT